MRYETRTERVGEWLGDVPQGWDYNAFYEKHLGQNRDMFDKSVKLFKEMDEALRRGAEVHACLSGGFWHKVYHCGLYDGWVFWVERPCISYQGPIRCEHRDEFYNLRHLRIVEKAKGESHE